MPSGSAANPGTFQSFNATARAAGQILRSVAIYGTPTDQRFAAVWHTNPGFVKGHVYPSETADGYQAVVHAETQLPGFTLHGYRPAYVAVSGNGTYCSIFKDDVVGPWVARHGLTAQQYQAEFNTQTAQGFYPICVQGGGSGAATRYAAIFAKQDLPAPRQWSVTGTQIPALSGFDGVMQEFMQVNCVRAAQLAIGKNGTLYLDRAYTWAENGYHVTQPSDRVLLASLSKIFVAAAVQSLYDTGKLTPAMAAYPLLGFSHPADARSDTITIQQLLDHMGGYDDQDPPSFTFDPTYNMGSITLSEALTPPIAKLGVARFMYGRMMDFAPGTNTKYSNFGYLLLSAVVEAVTKMDYFGYVEKTLLRPMGLGEVLVFSTAASGRIPVEVIAEDEGLGNNVLQPSSPLLVPAVYGGDGQVKEVAAGPAGAGASARAMASFISKHAVWGNGGRAPGFARSGSTPGTSTWAESRNDGVDFAFALNTRDWPPNASPSPVTDLKNQLGNMLDSISIP
jgi:CubicO group peptidase (beta-lactamase class C family)